MCHHNRLGDLRRLFPYVRPYLGRIGISVLLMAIVGMCQGLTVILIGPVIDRLLNPESSETSIELFKLPISGTSIYLDQLVPVSFGDLFTLFCTVLLMIFLLKGICDFTGNYLVNYAGFAAIRNLRNAMFGVVLNQSPAFFQSKHTGELVSSLVSDIEKIQSIFSHFLADLMRQTFTLIVLLLVLFTKDPFLAALSLIILPFVLFPISRVGKLIRVTSRRVQDELSGLVKIMQETITGNRIVKAFAREPFEINRFESQANRLFSSNMHLVKQQAIVSPIIETLAVITVLALLFYVRRRIEAGVMTAGEVVSFVAALMMLFQPVKRLIGIYNIFQQALGAAQRVLTYMDHPHDVRDKSRASRLPRFHNSIEFEKVDFFYPGTPETAALQNITFTVRPNEVIALVGLSGAGKTTLMSLLPRFFDTSRGTIRIDGYNICDVSLKSLRDQIAIVSQETFLFDDTIYNNIAYGRKDTDAGQVNAAAEAAHATKFIEALPGGFQTHLGERGYRLSGGQRQRISIARALLKDAPILLLDEATAHLDGEAEILVQRAISNLIHGRTVIVSTHRMSSIQSANNILVIDQGKIVDSGNHEDLLKHSILYKRLIKLQSGGD